MISSNDEAVLRRCFDSDSDDRPSYQEVSGFLFGLGMTPELILPTEWLGYIFENKNGAMEEADDEVIGSLINVYNSHVDAFNSKELGFPFNLAEMLSSNAEMSSLIGWVTGLVDALYMRAEFWDGSEFSELDHDRQQLLFHCVLMLEGIVEPEIVFEVFEQLPDEVLKEAYPTINLEGDNVPQQIIMICIMSSQEAVEVLLEHARELETLRKKNGTEASDSPRGKVIAVDFEKRKRK